MPLVSRHCIETIRQNVSILDVVSPYVTLKRSGSSWKGLSPFTAEKTPSFFVMPEKNIFKCFSSGHAGDIFRFLQIKENISFNDAIETIAQRHNQKIEYDEGSAGGSNDGSFSLKKEILELHELAANFFHKAFFTDKEESQGIRDYWTGKRNFSLEEAKEYGIGYAPVAVNALASWILKQKQFSDKSLAECGLFYLDKRLQGVQSWRSRFRGRLMVPIRDVQSRVVAFAGRQLDWTPKDDPAYEAKYINSPETPIFIKSKTLFGLEKARKEIDEDGQFIMVEGQLDVLRCWSHGLKTAIAPQGTGVTTGQLETLKRYCPKLLCVLDGDEAGQKAALRVLPLALKVGLDIAFSPLEAGEDPDGLLAAGKKDVFIEKIKNASGGVDFLVRSLLKGRKIGALSAGDKGQIFESLFEVLKECESQILQDDYLEQACRILHSNPSNVSADFARYVKSKSRFVQKEPQNGGNDEESSSKVTSVEYQLLMLVLNFEDIGRSLSQVIDFDWVNRESLEGGLLLRIFADIQEEVWTGPNDLNSVLNSDTERDYVYGILAEAPPFDEPKKVANQCLKSLFTNHINKKKLSIEEKIRTVSNFQSDGIRELQNERIALRKQLLSPPQIH